MNGGWGVDAAYIAKGLIQFSEEGLDVALRGAEALEQAANKATEALGKTAMAVTAGLGRALTSALQAPVRMLDSIRDKLMGLSNLISNSGLAQLARLTSIGGGAGIGAILYGASRDTTEANQLHMAIERLVQVVGDKLAPYFRMATQAVKELTQFWVELDNQLKISITKWSLVVTAVSGFIAVLPVMISGLAAVVGAISTLVAIAVSPWTLIIGGAVAAGVAIVSLVAELGLLGDSVKGFAESWLPGIESIGDAFRNMWEDVKKWTKQAMDFMLNTFDDLKVAYVTVGEKFGLFTQKDVAAMTAIRDAGRRVREFGVNQQGAQPFDPNNPPKIPRFASKAEEEADRKRREGPKPGEPGFIGPLEDTALGRLGKALERIQKAGAADAGFGRGTATFESGDATSNRLQLAASNQNPTDVAKAQLVEAQKGNEILQKVADNTRADNKVIAKE